MATRFESRAGRRRLQEVRILVAVAALTVAVRASLLTPVAVHGISMEPTVHDGDVLVVQRTATTTTEVHRGDLVVFHDPDGALSVKRVVGLPGDRVAMLDARLTVDGEYVDEPYVDLSRIDGTYLGQVVVPDGAVYVLGDNRSRSIDSREYGPVPSSSVIGTVLVRVFPPGSVPAETC
jgi:signal peptidase I